MTSKFGRRPSECRELRPVAEAQGQKSKALTPFGFPNRIRAFHQSGRQDLMGCEGYL